MPSTDTAAPDPYAVCAFDLAAPIDASIVHGALAARQAQHPAATSFDVQSVETTGSTNADLIDAARLHAPRQPVLRTAAFQTAGRGRQGRRWHGARGDALLLSVAVALGRRASADPATMLAAAVAVAEQFVARGIAVRIKWPNDLLLDGGKLGGMLAEVAVDARGTTTLVIGIGINLRADAALAAAAGQPVAALAPYLARIDARHPREYALALIADAVVVAVESVRSGGFAPWQSRFDALFAWRGQAVRLLAPAAGVHDDVTAASTACAMQELAAGVARGVDPLGRLLIETTDVSTGTFHGVPTAVPTVRSFASGDVSLRQAQAVEPRAPTSSQRSADEQTSSGHGC